jgi:hypothetical protein
MGAGHCLAQDVSGREIGCLGLGNVVGEVPDVGRDAGVALDHELPQVTGFLLMTTRSHRRPSPAAPPPSHPQPHPRPAGNRHPAVHRR